MPVPMNAYSHGLLAAWLLAAAGAGQCEGDKPVANLIDPQGHTAAEQQLLATCEERIRQYRMGELLVTVTDPQGNPVAGAPVHVQQVRHEFLFGCNAYALEGFGDPVLDTAYAEQFAQLLNYATLPFYWGSYEPQPGRTQQERIMRMARWCQARGIMAKGHPLVWHEVVPSWLEDRIREMIGVGAPQAVEALLEQRVRSIITAFSGAIRIWDVINEATVSPAVDNLVGRWVREVGVTEAVSRSLQWAREAGPHDTLLVNDFNIGPQDYPRLLEELLVRGAPFDAVGIQSHMHAGTAPFTRWWDVCDRYARYGKPLHFTEMTVLSGSVKTDHDWMGYHPGWDTTEEGEALQAQYVANLYRVLFSHPAVEAITWWDFSDAHAWQGAPAGLVRKDITPKPVYQRLKQLIRGEWWTDVTVTTDDSGTVRVPAFAGDYRVTVGEGAPVINTQVRRGQTTQCAAQL